MLNLKQLSLSLATNTLPSCLCGPGRQLAGEAERSREKGAQGSRGTIRPKASRPLMPSLSAASPTSQAVSGQGELTGVTCRTSQQRLVAFYHILEPWESTSAMLLGQCCLHAGKVSLFPSPRTMSAHVRARFQSALCQGA